MEDPWVEQRIRMVEAQIIGRGIKDERIVAAMKKVPRHLFVPSEMIDFAYNDEPVPIGEGQTISQPYIVAYMTEALNLKPEDKVLEIGTGSGYQTAILAEIVSEVYTVEIIASLSLRARDLLDKLGYHNIHFKIGDGSFGWEENSPYDAIMVTAAPTRIPKPLEEQLKLEGRMVVPVGSAFQELFLVTKEKQGFKRKKLLPVRFVPLITTH